MNALEAISEQARARNLEFLLAGGHAVIAHGHARNTFDIDLIIRRTDLDRWRQLAEDSGYKLHHQAATFIQFNPGAEEALPLDLMLVNEETFAKLIAEAVTGLGGLKIVSLLHLLALKCHAIRHGHARRIVKDVDDVIRLLQANRLDVSDPGIRDLVLKHGHLNSMPNYKGCSGKTDLENLEFPDWSGMDDSTARLSVEAALTLPELYRAWFPGVVRNSSVLSREKTDVEFVL